MNESKLKVRVWQTSMSGIKSVRVWISPRFPVRSDWSVVLPLLSLALVSMTKNISTIMHCDSLHFKSSTSLLYFLRFLIWWFRIALTPPKTRIIDKFNKSDKAEVPDRTKSFFGFFDTNEWGCMANCCFYICLIFVHVWCIRENHP